MAAIAGPRGLKCTKPRFLVKRRLDLTHCFDEARRSDTGIKHDRDKRRAVKHIQKCWRRIRNHLRVIDIGDMHIEFSGPHLVFEHRLAYPSGEIKNTGSFGKITPHRCSKTNRVAAAVDHPAEPGLPRRLNCSVPHCKERQVEKRHQSFHVDVVKGIGARHR